MNEWVLFDKPKPVVVNLRSVDFITYDDEADEISVEFHSGAIKVKASMQQFVEILGLLKVIKEVE